MPDPQRSELAAFLRNRRERITPTEVGLPSFNRRRTPGLRREEVALLSGVGVTWYTWLEQGRSINASEQVLTAIGRALKFDPDEHAHLLLLAGIHPAVGDPVCTVVNDSHLEIMEKLLPLPACIQTARFDVVAYNRTYRHLIDDIEKWPVADRNCAVLCFLDPHWAAAYEKHDQVSAGIVARLRSSMAEYGDDPALTAMVSRLRRESPEFERLWNRYDVQRSDNEVKGFRNPHVGLLRLQFTRLWLDQARTVRLTTCTPADEQSRRRLAELDARIAADPAIGNRPRLTAA